MVLILLVFGAGLSAGSVPRAGSAAVQLLGAFHGELSTDPLQSVLEWGEEIHSRACFELPPL